MNIIGKQKVDYISKKTNQPVRGLTLHCTTSRNDVEGEAVETVFVSEKAAMYVDVMKMPIGTQIICSYNRWGSIESVQACK